MNSKEILQMAIDYLPENIELVDVYTKDNLFNLLDKVETSILNGVMRYVYEACDDYINECEQDSVRSYIEQIKDYLFDKLPDDVEINLPKWINENREALEDEIYNRDVSNACLKLLSNTSPLPVYYDLGIFIDDMDYRNESNKDKVKFIINTLNIQGSCEDDLLSILNEATYGGHLVVFFIPNLHELICTKSSSIKFTHPTLAVIDKVNGSGSHETLYNTTMIVPLDRNRLFIDECHKYSYTKDVCGMPNDWCSGTEVVYCNEESNIKLKSSSLSVEKEIQKEYNNIFKGGKCSNGDTRMDRHRNVVYTNNIPCGWHCKDCGMFWID